MSTKKELLEQAQKLVADASALMQRSTGDAADVANATKMLNDADQLRSQAAVFDRLDTYRASADSFAKSVAEESAKTGEKRSAAEVREGALAEVRNLAKAALRGETRIERSEFRDLTLTADGSFLVPTTVTDPKYAQRSSGYIYDLVDKIRTTAGNPITLPLMDDTANFFVLSSTANLAVAADPSITSVTLTVDDLISKPILIDASLAQDSSIDLLEYVAERVQERYLKSVSNMITNGDASNVQGLLAVTGSTVNVAAGSNSAVVYTDFTNMIASLDPAYAQNAVFTMNNNTLATQVLNIKSTTGFPIFQPLLNSGTSEFIGQILGYPVKVNQFLPNVGPGNVAVQFGDFKQAYTFREAVPSATIEQLGAQLNPVYPFAIKFTKDRYVELNKIGVIAYARIAGKQTIASSTYTPLLNLVKA